MAFAFHGIITFYGEREYEPDGSFVTTEWFTLAYLPIFPITSKRMCAYPKGDLSTYDASGYFVHEILPLNLNQVVAVYGWFAAIFAPIIVWGTFQDALTKMVGDEDLAAGLCLLFSATAFVSPYFFRRWAKQRKMKEWQRQSLGMHGRPL
jgi:hypothetical protein